MCNCKEINLKFLGYTPVVVSSFASQKNCYCTVLPIYIYIDKYMEQNKQDSCFPLFLNNFFKRNYKLNNPDFKDIIIYNTQLLLWLCKPIPNFTVASDHCCWFCSISDGRIYEVGESKINLNSLIPILLPTVNGDTNRMNQFNHPKKINK